MAGVQADEGSGAGLQSSSWTLTHRCYCSIKRDIVDMLEGHYGHHVDRHGQTRDRHACQKLVAKQDECQPRRGRLRAHEEHRRLVDHVVAREILTHVPVQRHDLHTAIWCLGLRSK